MAPRTLPSQALLRECFVYDPETGILTWRERPCEHFKNAITCSTFNKCFAGKQAGCKDGRTGGLVVIIGKVKYLVHRVIWTYVTGEQPPEQIDHRNRNPYDNRWENLRAATQNQNMHNRGVNKDNFSTGIKGVTVTSSGKFGARLMVNGVSTWLGSFPTAELAKAALNEARMRMHGEFASPG